MDPIGPEHETDLTGLEDTLASLRPSAIALDRDRLLFEAGRAAGRAEWRGRIGSAMVAGLALIAVGLGVLLARERGARMGLEATLASLDARAPSAPRIPLATIDDGPFDQPGPNTYLALTRHFLSGGIDPVPGKRPGSPPAPAPIAPTEAPELLRLRAIGELLEL